ncbi:MAG: glutamate 5-kinase [Gammaproteobacteria bacterium]
MKKIKQRWIIKAGSSLVSSKINGLDDSFIASLVKIIQDLKKKRIEVVIVSSGAVAQGMHELGIDKRPGSLPLLQASAAIGQMGLVKLYQKEFQKFSILAAQVLISHSDIANRERYLNARHSLNTLLDLGVVPVVNENDSVATQEISFGDNDSLAGALAGVINANKLIILTDQKGVYTKDPDKESSAEFIKVIDLDEKDLDLNIIAMGDAGSLGRGGMKTKLQAATKASTFGCETWILKGNNIDDLLNLDKEFSGTKIISNKSTLSSRKQWIASRGKSLGKIIIDQGATKALLNEGRSLLPVGILSSSGDFQKGDLISCHDQEGKEVALGLSNFSSIELGKILGLKSKELSLVLGKLVEEEVIHRDNLVLS